jgi:hypothetical protein
MRENNTKYDGKVNVDTKWKIIFYVRIKDNYTETFRQSSLFQYIGGDNAHPYQINSDLKLFAANKYAEIFSGDQPRQC